MSHIRPHLIDEPHWVYRLYDENDNILYVGCTVKFPRDRVVSLRAERTTRLAEAMHRWEADLYPNGPAAMAHEGDLIDELDPPFNTMRDQTEPLQQGPRGGGMSCELCRFTDRRRYRLTSLHWKQDGWPLLSLKVSCPECGWWQTIDQVWAT